MREATNWELQNLKGIIYLIFNKVNRKCYFGQTVNYFRKRYKGFSVPEFDHYSIRLQKCLSDAVKKYGTNNFSIHILEHSKTVEELNQLEEFYISFYNSICPNGYNLKHGGENKNHHQSTKDKIAKSHEKSYKFLNNRTGEIIDVVNLSRFCKLNSLSNPLMVNLSKGKYCRHKEWTLPDKPLKKYYICSDAGEIIMFLYGEISSTARKLGLNKLTLMHIIHGKYIKSRHNGWRLLKIVE